MSDIFTVIWNEAVDKQLERLPWYIQNKFFTWADAVKRAGIRTVRTRPGYHDEPLKGKRLGQRSARLNRGYRIIYAERTVGRIEILEVMEVTNHGY